MAFYAHRIDGLMYGQHRREVIFLACDDAKTGVNAEVVFNALNSKDKRRMLDKFDWWARGNDLPSHWFHGFNDEDRKCCFVFKRKKANTHYRYYGFLLHPMPTTDPGYRLCVLVRHAQKNTEGTDPGETGFVNVVRVRVDVIAAIRKVFPEKKGASNDSLYVN